MINIMNIKEQKEKYYRLQSASMLRISLSELSAIDSYEKGTFEIPNGRKDIFDKLVSRIVNEYTSQNDINEELIQEQFGINGYEEGRVLQSLIYYEAGKRLAQKQDISLKDLAELYDNVYVSLFYGLELKYELVSKLIKDLVDDFDNEVLLKSRIFHSSGERISNEIKAIYKSGATEDAIISKMDMYNDGSYTELPLAVDAISYICGLHGYYDLWIQLFDDLRYFPLQGALLYQIHWIEGYIELLKHVSGKDNAKVVSKLSLDKFLKLLCDVPEHLVANSESGVLNEEQRVYCTELLKQWNKNYNNLVSAVTILLIDCLGVEDFISWMSREMRRVENLDVKFAKNPKAALLVMQKVADDYGSKVVPELDKCSFDSLLYFASLADNYSREVCQQLVSEICRRAYTDGWVPAMTLSDEGFEKLRSLYRLLERSEINGEVLMKQYRKAEEGYAVDKKASLNVHYGDNFWLPVLVLQYENNNDEKGFKRLLQYLFKRVNTGSTISSDDYFTSFYLAELIVTQIMPDIQNEYESTLIDNVSDLVFVLRVLTANEGKMSNEIVKKLKDRIKSEWKFEKKLYRKRDNDQIRFLEEYIAKL